MGEDEDGKRRGTVVEVGHGAWLMPANPCVCFDCFTEPRSITGSFTGTEPCISFRMALDFGVLYRRMAPS